jgi:micrococcal nuclease
MKPLISPKTFLPLACTLLSICQSCCKAQAEEIPAWLCGGVTRVVDGDTFYVGDAEIRLKGVDCPEKRQPYGKEATALTTKLILGEQVQCQIFREKGKQFDRYGRYVALVRIQDSGKWLQDELVKAGAAWCDPRFNKDESLDEMQAEAKADKRGLWKDPHPIEPRLWRKGIRK